MKCFPTACDVNYWVRRTSESGFDGPWPLGVTDFMFRVCDSPVEWEIAGIRFSRWLRENLARGYDIKWLPGQAMDGELFSVVAEPREP